MVGVRLLTLKIRIAGFYRLVTFNFQIEVERTDHPSSLPSG